MQKSSTFPYFKLFLKITFKTAEEKGYHSAGMFPEIFSGENLQPAKLFSANTWIEETGLVGSNFRGNFVASFLPSFFYLSSLRGANSCEWQGGPFFYFTFNIFSKVCNQRACVRNGVAWIS